MRAEQVRRISWISLLLAILLVLFCFWRFQCKTESPQPHRTEIILTFSNPKVKNNIDLVKYAKYALDCKWGYVYGTYGQILDASLLGACQKKYADEVLPYLDFTQKYWMGGRVTDCAGLIKGYGWLDPERSEICYLTNGIPDLSANGMEQAAVEKGTMEAMPEIPGLAVWMNGHIGVYIGNEEVIEAMSSKKGVVKTKLNGRGWMKWLKVPFIQYG